MYTLPMWYKYNLTKIENVAVISSSNTFTLKTIIAIYKNMDVILLFHVSNSRY